jgi:hypothetical protein
MILSKTTEATHANTHIVQPTRLFLLGVAALAMSACQTNKISPTEEDEVIRKAEIVSTAEGVTNTIARFYVNKTRMHPYFKSI